MHEVKEVDMLSTKLDLLMKKLDDRAGDKKEIMHVYDSHMTCEECGDSGHSGNHCPDQINYLCHHSYFIYLLCDIYPCMKEIDKFSQLYMQ